MKVSIITSCFNRVATIRGAIESVLAQDYNNIEFIVVDGASTDGSLEIIREYEDRISTIISEPDHGMYVYISCKMTSLARDLEMMQMAGYRVEKMTAVDQFCETVHVETVVLMSRTSK